MALAQFYSLTLEKNINNMLNCSKKVASSHVEIKHVLITFNPNYMLAVTLQT
jgi:hypothetical protein